MIKEWMIEVLLGLLVIWVFLTFSIDKLREDNSGWWDNIAVGLLVILLILFALWVLQGI